MTTIAQDLQDSSIVSKLKPELKKVKDSLVSMLFSNITLDGDNSNLKACVAALELESKGLENRATNVKDSANLNVKEMERLKTLLALVEKERDAKKEEKAWVEQTSYDDVYEAYTSGFNHCLCQVLFHCEVHDESIFYIEKKCL